MKKFVLSELTETHEVAKSMQEILEKATLQKVALIYLDKMTKKAGVLSKKITFAMEEGQSLGLVFRQDGDVIEVSLNNRKIPLLSPIDYDNEKLFIKGLQDLALKLKINQSKFDQKRQSAKVVIPKARNASLTVKKRIAQAREALQNNQDIISQKRELLESKKRELDVLKSGLATGSA